MALTKVKGHIIADDLALGGNPTTSTQSTGNNTTRLATTAFVQTELAALVDSSPSALNTLNELAAAIGDDANFSTTVTNSIATKAPLATPQFTNRVGIGVAAHGTAALNITSTAQHIRLNNGSELGVLYLDSAGILNVWAHGDGESLILRTGSGTGTAALTIAGVNSTFAGDVVSQSSVQVFRQAAGAASVLLQRSGAAGPWSLAQGNTATNYFEILEGSNSRLTIKNGGNVGIGTTDPAYQLHIAGGGDFLVEDTGNGSAHIRLRSSSGGTASSNWKIKTGSNNYLYVENDTVGTTDIAISNTGKLGIGISVPTQKLDVAGTALLENAKLKAISESNSLTVTDLFIYDTTKDSDGGAWRKKIKHTAWYNEATSATRAGRKEFPSIAVLAFNLNQELYIYDGDDPDLGLWAKYSLFTQDSGGFASITAVNGSIYGAQAASSYNYSGNGYFQLNFAADYFFSNISSVFNNWRQGRAAGLLTTYDYRTRGDRLTPKYVLANNGYQISDMAVKVLGNATIDTETGLPKPNIALAGYYGGLSVVKDTGNVVDITASAGAAYHGVTWVDITKNDNLIFEQDNSSNPRSIFCIPIPSADRTTATSDGAINDKVVMKFYRGGSHKPYPVFNGGGVNEAVALEGDNQLLKSSGGDLTILEPNLVSPASGKVAYIGHDYNSGWLVGDTKVATLSDTSTTSATSPDLVTNGSNFSNTTGWTGAGASVSVSSSELLVTGTASNASNQSATWTTISCTKGDQFQVTFRISAFVANQSSAGIIVGGATIHKNNDLGYWYPNTAATHTTTVTATGANFTLYLHAGISVGVVTRFDDISIHKLQHDRTQYKHGFQTFGTLAKSVVATGAELVGYGPFSSNNYLQQSYTSELDFNSGDFAYCFWSNNANSGSEYIADRAEGNGNYRIALYLSSADNGTMNFYTRDTAATEMAAIIGTPNQWAQIWCIRRGTSHEIWVNGINKNTNIGTVRDVSNASGDAVQKIGTRYSGSGPNTGKIALFRISGTAPSEEQIKKIYNDERKLFEINSDATMGGDSSAATVLAYDDVREEMHVGSSWGRTVFQGLSRVGFDSSVPTASLSVNDGFVVEE